MGGRRFCLLLLLAASLAILACELQPLLSQTPADAGRARGSVTLKEWVSKSRSETGKPDEPVKITVITECAGRTCIYRYESAPPDTPDVIVPPMDEHGIVILDS